MFGFVHQWRVLIHRLIRVDSDRDNGGFRDEPEPTASLAKSLGDKLKL